MFWIIPTIIGAIIIYVYGERDENGNMDLFTQSYWHTVTTIATALFICVIAIQFAMGVSEYPSLSKELAQINSLENRIKDIKDASYAYKKDGEFIAGSIENYQQSTNLSKFIDKLASKEAAYSGNLIEAKIHKKMFPLYFFSYGWAISDRINDLKVIE